MKHYTKKVKAARPLNKALDQTATTRRPPTVDEFLTVNPLPAQLKHLEPSLRKLPHVGLIFQILLGCMEHDMSNADVDRVVADVGAMFSRPQQRCAACFCWTDKFHAIVAGTVERFAVAPYPAEWAENYNVTEAA